ncbi:MAG: A/G-specific adenine glycosylase, partial [Planctomycetota bacterium]
MKRRASRSSAAAVGVFDPRERVALRRALLAWFRRHQRDLPWRRTRDPYAIWLSEIMLQQTRVESVRPYYERFIARFPTVRSLAAAALDDVLALWSGLGYYARGRNLHRAAQVIVERHDGRLPRCHHGLLTLPGVGRYTAAAIASIAFDAPVAAVDGNVKRVLARLALVREPIDALPVGEGLQRIADELLARRAPGDFNQALMELGATICTPKNPNCRRCPLRNWCRAARRGLQSTIPLRRPKRAPRVVEAASAAIWRAKRLLLVQRRPHGLLGGLWE